MLYSTAQVCTILNIKRPSLFNLQRRAKVVPIMGRVKRFVEVGQPQNLYDSAQLAALRRTFKALISRREK
jgi:hypothetical protein